jgi:hypothetical protein
MKNLKTQELRAVRERLLIAARAAQSDASRKLYTRRAMIMESLAKDMAWLDAEQNATLRTESIDARQ